MGIRLDRVEKLGEVDWALWFSGLVGLFLMVLDLG